MRLSRNGKRLGRPPKPIPTNAANDVIEALYDGGSVTAFCEEPGRPKRRTVYEWCERDPEFDARFARARVAGATAKVELAWEIAKRATPENVQVAKLQVETLLKQAACFAPHVYGLSVQRIDTNHSVRITLATGVTPSSLEHSPRLTVEPAHTQLPQPPHDTDARE